MASTTVKVMDKGPYIVSGDVEVVDVDGNKFTEKQQFSLCRCGHSQKKPFCDGQHRGQFEDCARATAL